jgi:hypothetical protein
MTSSPKGTKWSAATRFAGTHKGPSEEYGQPTGKEVVVEGISLYHFREGKVEEIWDRYDNWAVMQQLGITSEAEPPPRVSASGLGLFGWGGGGSGRSSRVGRNVTTADHSAPCRPHTT